MSHDAIIIGAGHNGLVAAARLARSGRRVLVLEARAEPGGLLGGEAPLASMPFGLHPDIARALQLDRHGLRYGKPLTTISLGGAEPVRIDGARVTGVDGATAAAHAALHGRLCRYAGVLGRLLLKTPPRLRGGGMADAMTLGRLGLSVRMLGKSDMRDLLRIVLSNAWDLLGDEIGDGPLAGALAMDATLGGAMGPRSPGTVLTLLYRRAGQGAGAAGQRAVPLGGVPVLVEALVKAAEAVGAVIRTDAAVGKILVGDDDRVAGVRLQSGEEIRAGLVLSNAAPRRTLIELLGVAHLDGEDVRRVRTMSTNGMVTRVDLDLSEPPAAAGLDAAELSQRVVLAPDMRRIERAFNAAKYGDLPEAPVLEFTALPDNRLAVTAQFVPHALRGGWSDTARDQLRDSVIAQLDAVLPGCAARVTGAAVRSPADIESEYGLPGGHWHHGELRVDQMLSLRPFAGAAQYRMPVGGLYLCGAGAHPGGDISGAPGWNAAGQALRDGGTR